MRKRSTIKGMNGGVFMELQKMYNDSSNQNPFQQNSEEVIRHSVEMLDKLIDIVSDGTSPSSIAAGKGQNKIEESVEEPSKANSWIQMTDPDSGEDYYYNTVSGESSWSLPKA